MGNKKYHLSTDDYIFAAISIYVDIIGLFLEILRLLGRD
jgi:FtsH-binding integral membrane protein